MRGQIQSVPLALEERKYQETFIVCQMWQLSVSIVSNTQVKQCCYSNQFIAISDNETSNLPSIYVKWRQVKSTGNRASGRERETERTD